MKTSPLLDQNSWFMAVKHLGIESCCCDKLNIRPELSEVKTMQIFPLYHRCCHFWRHLDQSNIWQDDMLIWRRIITMRSENWQAACHTRVQTSHGSISKTCYINYYNNGTLKTGFKWYWEVCQAMSDPRVHHFFFTNGKSTPGLSDSEMN